jgi:hypothetical protein
MNGAHLADYRTMKPPFAHLSSPIVPATVAAAIGVSLSVFLLPAAGVQVEPTPLLPAIGEVAGRVAADLPVAAKKLSSPAVRQAATPAQVAATRTEHFVPKQRQVATPVHHAIPRARTRVIRRVSPAAVPAGTPAPARPVFTPPKGKGHGRGHSHQRQHKLIAGAPARPKVHGGGNAPPKVHGGGNGHKGDKK